MSLKQQVQDRIKECMKARNSFEQNILKTIVGEIQSKEVKSGDLKDEEVESLIRKFKAGTIETIVRAFKKIEDEDEVKALVSDLSGLQAQAIGEATSTSEEAKSFIDEIAIYDIFLPQTLSVDEIIAELDAESIKEVGNDGQAMGMAMKNLKRAVKKSQS